LIWFRESERIRSFGSALIPLMRSMLFELPILDMTSPASESRSAKAEGEGC
jgi:hypothetical protein